MPTRGLHKRCELYQTLSTQKAGNANREAGDRPVAGAQALLAALEKPDLPMRLILGVPGLAVTAFHNERRAAERAKWHATATLERTAP